MDDLATDLSLCLEMRPCLQSLRRFTTSFCNWSSIKEREQPEPLSRDIFRSLGPPPPFRVFQLYLFFACRA